MINNNSPVNPTAPDANGGSSPEDSGPSVLASGTHTPITTNPEMRARTPADPALRAAWEKLIQYDQAALQQKQWHIRLRVIILVLGFLSSVAAIALSSSASFYHNRNLLRLFLLVAPIVIAWVLIRQQKQWVRQRRIWVIILAAVSVAAALWLSTDENSPLLHGLLKFMLFLFPLLTSGLLTFGSRFIPSGLWAKFRFSAEMIRREIFLYRMQAGDYYDKPTLDQQQLLLGCVEKANNYCQQPVSLFSSFLPADDDGQTFMTEVKAVGGDDGFQAMAVGDYIGRRLANQYQWYVDKSFNEYRQMRRWQIISLIIGSAGALLAYLGYAPWVAVTTSAAVTVNMLASLTMYGRTYSIYLVTADKLHRLKVDWDIRSCDRVNDRQSIAKYVNDTEQVFKEEIEAWMQQVEKSVGELEQELERLLPKKLTDTAPEARNATG